MKKDQLPVSRKFYNDISLRINEALSAAPASATEAMRIVDGYMTGQEPASDDPMSMLAFNMIKTEIDRAMSRSQRARERAAARRSAAETGLSEQDPQSSAENGTEEAPETDTETAPRRHMSRRERRAALNLIRRLSKPRWGAIT